MDYKRAIGRNFVQLKSTANTTRNQLFRLIPLVEIARGADEQQRLGPSILLDSIDFTLHIVCDYLTNKISKVENVPTAFSSGSHVESSSLTIAHPSYNENLSGFNGTIVGITVPVDGQEFTQLLSASNYIPAYDTNILSANGDNITTNGQNFYKDGNAVFTFSVPRLWKIKNEVLVRMMVIRCNYILDETVANGDTYFTVRNTQMNPYNGLLGGNNIPVGSYFKNEFDDIFEIVWEKMFNMNSKRDLFYHLSIPGVFDTRCEFRENARSPTFNNFDIATRTLVQPLQNNYYLMLMSNPTYGCNNLTDLYSEPTYGQVPVNWAIDLNKEIVFHDIVTK